MPQDLTSRKKLGYFFDDFFTFISVRISKYTALDLRPILFSFSILTTMGGLDVLEEYFFFIENNKEIEDEKNTEASELMCRILDSNMWNIFIEKSFDGTALQEHFTSVTSEVRSKLLKFGISCFIHFVQANFTGPDLKQEVLEIFKNPRIEAIDFPKFLKLNNEEINVNTKHPLLLVMSKCVFEKCLVSNIVNSLWSWRSMIIHQQIMDEYSPLLLSQAETLKKQIDTFNLQGYEKAKFDIEFAQLYLIFGCAYKSKSHIYSAENILGIHYSLEGKVSKRKQGKEAAELSLQIKLSDEPSIKRPPVIDFELPKVVKSSGRVASSDHSSKGVPNIIIPNTEQKLLLAKVNEMLIAKYKDDIQVEELRPYIDVILNQKNTWAVRVATMLLSCRIEIQFGKVVHKHVDQLREIMNCCHRLKPNVLTRFADVFSTGLAPMWKVETICAIILVNLGMAKQALEINMRIKNWEGAVTCMKSKQKAVELIKAQLEKEETVRMLCLLGDVADDVTYYEKAWEVSRKRSYRAQEKWGDYLYNRKQYQECIPHYEKSGSINPLQPHVWQRLGHAAQLTDKWHIAATALRRYTNFQPDGFQAWYNLAQAYLKINNKHGAQYALTEALKYNFENWKIWENLLVVSSDTLSYTRMFNAYHKILDLKGKYLNLEALNILVFNLCNDISDEYKKAELRLRSENGDLLRLCRELLGRVLSVYPGEGYIWELYASLVPPSLLRAQRFQRAFKSYTQPGWDKSPQTCVQVMCLCIKLAELVLTKGIDLHDHLLNTVKSNLSSAVAATKKHDWEESRTLVEEVSVHLEKLVDKVKKLTENSKEINSGEKIIIH